MKKIMRMLAITILLMVSACGRGGQPADLPSQEPPAETVVSETEPSKIEVPVEEPESIQRSTVKEFI